MSKANKGHEKSKDCNKEYWTDIAVDKYWTDIAKPENNNQKKINISVENTGPSNLNYYKGKKDEKTGKIGHSDYDLGFEGNEVYDITNTIKIKIPKKDDESDTKKD